MDNNKEILVSFIKGTLVKRLVYPYFIVSRGS